MTTDPFCIWGLAGTRADAMRPGDTLLWFCTSEESVLPYRTVMDRPLAVRTSTFNETVFLYNATLDPDVAKWHQYHNTLLEWPWTFCLEQLPKQTGYIPRPYLFEALNE